MFLDYCTDNESIFCVSNEDQLFVKASVSTGIIEKYEFIKNGKKEGGYNKAVDCGSKIVFIPSHSKEFLVIEKESCLMNRIPIPHIEISQREYSFFGDGVYVNNTVYAFGLSYPGVVKIDLLKGTAELLIDLREKGCKGLCIDNCILENTVYFPFEKEPTLLAFNYIEEEADVIHIEDEKIEDCKIVSFDGFYFWIISRNNVVCKYDRSFRFIEEIVALEEMTKGKEVFKSIFWEGFLFFFFLKENRILRYRVSNGDSLWIDIPYCKKILGSAYYVILKDSGPCFYSEDLNCFCRIIRGEKVEVDNIVSKKDYVNIVYHSKHINNETSFYDLESFIESI